MDNILNKFKNKKIFITGHTGFKGSWLSLILHDLGADVCGYSLPPKKGNNHFSLLGLDQIVKHVEGNVLDLNHLSSSINKFQPDL